MSLSCQENQNGKSGCACSPPTASIKKSSFFFMIAVLGGVLLIAFNAVKGYEQEALNAQSLSMVFVLGFLTGLHCIGMCGGFMMSYLHYGKEQQMSELQMHVRYSISKIISYSLLGAVFGLLGSWVYFSSDFKSAASLAGGVFLLYLGAKGLGVFARFKMPDFSKRFSLKTKHLANPVSVGLLNGLMISCAPLQAMYLLAASLGNPGKGALILAVFGLGTLPIFLFYGVFVGSLTKIQARWSDIITASIVVVFGILMINRGIALGGYELNFSALFSADTRPVQTEHQFDQTTQKLSMNADHRGWSKSRIPYQFGQKIHWEIYVTELTMCNKTIEIPRLGISKELKEGLNVIEFDPGQSSKLVYTCWMGMMKGEFVAEYNSSISESPVKLPFNN